MSGGGVKEVVPKTGLLFQEVSLHPVLCKPKLLPLKSVTLEKLEKMQKDAQEKVWEMEMKEEEPAKAGEAECLNLDDDRPTSGTSERGEKQQPDIWKAEDDLPTF